MSASDKTSASVHDTSVHDTSVHDTSVSDKLQAVVDEAHEAYEAGPSTVNRKLNQVDKVLGAAVEAIQNLDESHSS